MPKKKKIEKVKQTNPFFLIFLIAGIIWLVIILRAYLKNQYTPLSLYPFLNFFSTLPEFLEIKPILIFENFINLTVTILIIASAYGAGKLLLKKITFTSLMESTLIRIGIGFGFYSILFLFIGLLGFLYKPVFWVIILINLLWIFIFKERISFKYQMFSLGEKFLILMIFIFCLFYFLNSFMPEIFYDSLVYHLAAPNYFLINHKILPMHYVINANFPANVQMLYMIALALRNEISAKLIHFFCLVFTIFTIYTIGKNISNRITGLMAGLFFCITPIVGMNTTVAGNDVGLSFFSCLCIFSLLNYLKNGELKSLILSGIFAGLMLGSKYTTSYLIFSLVLTLILLQIKNKKFIKILQDSAIFLSVIFLLFSPWLFKNYILLKNPIYPFLSSHLGIAKGGRIFWNEKTNNPVIFKNYKDIFSLFIDQSLKGYTNMNYLGPVFLMFLPFGFIWYKSKLEVKFLMMTFLFIYILFVFSTVERGFRYIIPSLIPLALAISYGISHCLEFISEKLKKIFKFGYLLILFAISTQLFNSLFNMAKILKFPQPIIGKITKDDYLSERMMSYPYPSYKGISYINNLPKDSKILILGEARSFYLKKNFLISGADDYTPIVDWANNVDSGDELYKKITDENITHIFLNLPEGVRLGKGYFHIFYWTEKGLKNFNEFWDKYLEEIYQNPQGHFIYKILTSQETKDRKKIPINLLQQLEKTDFSNQAMIEIYIKNKFYSQAIYEYNEILKYYPNAAEIYMKIATVYLLSGDKSSALENINKALSIEPQNPRYIQFKNYLQMQ